ncbi:BlaI/MecI/CopY family transcriptional regulator [Paenibacillus filicis]|uniref:BlaI/MecI/CopY family transcriptional regulator n=1 Tax=Paenibacillus filicis TaxID=669464 RepID=A0ABU9DLQ0_9BACL
MQWSDQTIKTFLNRLHKKNAIRFEKSGRNYLYELQQLLEKKKKA